MHTGEEPADASGAWRIGPLLVGLGLLALFVQGAGLVWPRVEGWAAGLSPIKVGLLASLVAGLFTVVGALPVLLMRSISRATEDTLMGFAAGVMLAATAFELVMPAVEGAQGQYGSVAMTILVLATGIGLGGGALLLLHRLVPHEHFVIGPQSGADPRKVKRIYLFIFAIALHNLPEGLAVGVGFGGELADGITLAVAIGLQNMPEGLIVAVALMSLGYGKWTALGVTLLTGLVQPVGGLVGITAVTLVSSLLPWALAFAGGAMLFVVSHEIIPESHREGHEGRATFGVLAGFVALVAIDLAVG